MRWRGHATSRGDLSGCISFPYVPCRSVPEKSAGVPVSVPTLFR